MSLIIWPPPPRTLPLFDDGAAAPSSAPSIVDDDLYATQITLAGIIALQPGLDTDERPLAKVLDDDLYFVQVALLAPLTPQPIAPDNELGQPAVLDDDLNFVQVSLVALIARQPPSDTDERPLAAILDDDLNFVQVALQAPLTAQPYADPFDQRGTPPVSAIDDDLNFAQVAYLAPLTQQPPFDTDERPLAKVLDDDLSLVPPAIAALPWAQPLADAGADLPQSAVATIVDEDGQMIGCLAIAAPTQQPPASDEQLAAMIDEDGQLVLGYVSSAPVAQPARADEERALTVLTIVDEDGQLIGYVSLPLIAAQPPSIDEQGGRLGHQLDDDQAAPPPAGIGAFDLKTWPQWVYGDEQHSPTIALQAGPRYIARRLPLRLFTVSWPQPRTFAASRPAGRLFTVSAVTSPRFDTKLPGEEVVLVFNFTPDLLPTETLTGTPEIASIVVSYGTDGTPTEIENGAPQINSSTVTLTNGTTIAPGYAVLVPVQAGLDETDYDITVQCPTTNPAKVLELLGTLPVRAKP